MTKEGIGPVLAVSCKGAIGAFRNLTNRMEEAVGDCTNLHIAYPPLVCGYLFVMRANRSVEVGRDLGIDEHGLSRVRLPRKLAENVDADGRPVESIRRWVRLFCVGGPEGSRRGCERHGKSYLTLRRRGEAGDGGGSLTGGAIPSA